MASNSDQLLHFHLVEKIGEGGMGVVWKAVDTTLDREVAIKILPDVLGADAERLARFEREARLLASLNHPNIAGIYGIHTDAGQRFLAMELIEGEDLAQRLARGALPRDETLHVGRQVALAIEAAHENGVVHRDLKPANIKIAPDGVVKVLDFGLAKALAQETTGEGGSPSMSPTLTSAGTTAGLILGTASYMSPEQAKGQEVDRRADIWSFGVVLFEMLTGRRLFQGDTVSETLAAVIMKEVDWDALPANTPAPIRRMLQRCLHRDPRSRLRDIGDARIAIEEALEAPDAVEIVAPMAARRPLWQSLLPWVVTAACLVALAVVWSNSQIAPEPLPVMRFTLTIPEEQALDADPRPTFDLSPDGTRLVFRGAGPTRNMLHLRHIHQQEATPLNGTEGAFNPFFSPDGQWIAFEQGGKLKKISVLGGPPTTLCDAPRLRGGSWGTDGSIVFAPDRSSGLFRVSEAGGEPEALTQLEFADAGSLGSPSHRWPDVLPGARAAIFTSTPNNSNYDKAEIVGVSFADGRQTTIVKGGTFARYVPPGFLVYARESTLFAARFDSRRLALTGPAVPVLEDVAGAPNWGSRQLTFSDNGTLMYLRGPAAQFAENLVWLDRNGNETPASAHKGQFDSHDLSPDDTQVAAAIVDKDAADIWILELARDSLTRLTFDPGWDTDPLWSPDGEWIVFTSTRDGDQFNLYRKRASGIGEVERLTTSARAQSPRSWSPDGKLLVFEEEGEGGRDDIMLLHMDQEPSVEVFLQTPFQEGHPTISPDGEWVAYFSTESGEPEIYVRPLSGSGSRTRISSNRGIRPRWGPDGKELFYVSWDNQLMAVRFSIEGESFRPELPRAVFDYPRTFSTQFGISRDGSRILADKDVDSDPSGARQPTIVVNWFAELVAKVP